MPLSVTPDISLFFSVAHLSCVMSSSRPAPTDPVPNVTHRASNQTASSLKINMAFPVDRITVLRALKKAGRLDADNFPSLETVLRLATGFGEAISGMSGQYPPTEYHRVLKGIGRRLFHGKSDPEKEREAKMVEEWIKGLSQG